jgi:hypothetical protein
MVTLPWPEPALDDGCVAELGRAANAMVVARAKNWQAMMGGRHITVPVRQDRSGAG